MSGQFKRGDVALLVTSCCGTLVATKSHDGGWHVAGGKDRTTTCDIREIRPLVVIDPEDREQVEGLAKAIWDAPDNLLEDTVTCVEFALRSLIAPPKPEVYEHFPADTGVTYVRSLCGKIWTPESEVTVVGKCPECVALVDSGWTV